MMAEPRVSILARCLSRVGLDASLLRDSAAVLVLLAIGASFSFAVQVLLARLLGPEQFGIYSLVMTWVLTLSLFVALGLDSTIMRFVAAYGAVQRLGAMRGLIRRTRQIVMAASLLAAGGMVAASLFLRPGLSCSFVIGALLLPFLTLLQLNSKLILALQFPSYGVAIGSVLRNLLLLAFVCIAGVGLHLVQDARISLLLACFSAIISAVTSYYLLPALLPRDTSDAEYHTREWIRVALPLLAVTAAEQILTRGDMIVLGAFRTRSEVGLYAAVISLATGLDMIMTATNSVIAPAFAQLHARCEFGQLQTLLTRSTAMVFVGILPLSTIFIFGGEQVLHLFGNRFVAAAGALSLLAIAHLVRGFTGPVGLMLSMTGHHSVFAKSLAVIVAATLLFDFLLVPRYGPIGAASATLLGTALRSLILGGIAVVRLGAMPTLLAPLLPKVVDIVPFGQGSTSK